MGSGGGKFGKGLVVGAVVGSVVASNRSHAGAARRQREDQERRWRYEEQRRREAEEQRRREAEERVRAAEKQRIEAERRAALAEQLGQGRASFAEGHMIMAAHHFDEALRLDGNNDVALHYAGKIKLKDKAYASAASYFSRVGQHYRATHGDYAADVNEIYQYYANLISEALGPINPEAIENVSEGEAHLSALAGLHQYVNVLSSIRETTVLAASIGAKEQAVRRAIGLLKEAGTVSLIALALKNVNANPMLDTASAQRNLAEVDALDPKVRSIHYSDISALTDQIAQVKREAYEVIAQAQLRTVPSNLANQGQQIQTLDQYTLPQYIDALKIAVGNLEASMASFEKAMECASLSSEGQQSYDRAKELLTQYKGSLDYALAEDKWRFYYEQLQKKPPCTQLEMQANYEWCQWLVGALTALAAHKGHQNLNSLKQEIEVQKEQHEGQLFEQRVHAMAQNTTITSIQGYAANEAQVSRISKKVEAALRDTQKPQIREALVSDNQTQFLDKENAVATLLTDLYAYRKFCLCITTRDLELNRRFEDNAVSSVQSAFSPSGRR